MVLRLSVYGLCSLGDINDYYLFFHNVPGTHFVQPIKNWILKWFYQISKCEITKSDIFFGDSMGFDLFRKRCYQIPGTLIVLKSNHFAVSGATRSDSVTFYLSKQS